MEKQSSPAGYSNYKQQIEVWTRLQPGARVQWCPNPEEAHMLFGVVECENNRRPGWFFVRDESNILHCINWGLLLVSQLLK